MRARTFRIPAWVYLLGILFFLAWLADREPIASKKVKAYILENDCKVLPINGTVRDPIWSCDTGYWTRTEMYRKAEEVPDDRLE